MWFDVIWNLLAVFGLLWFLILALLIVWSAILKHNERRRNECTARHLTGMRIR